MPTTTYILRNSNFPSFVEITKKSGYEVLEIEFIDLISLIYTELDSLNKKARKVYENVLISKYGLPLRIADPIDYLGDSGVCLQSKRKNFRSLMIAQNGGIIDEFVLENRPGHMTDEVKIIAKSLASKALESAHPFSHDGFLYNPFPDKPSLYDRSKPKDFAVQVKEDRGLRLEPEIRKLFEEIPRVVPKAV